MKIALRFCFMTLASFCLLADTDVVSQVNDSAAAEVHGEMQYEGPLIEEIRKVVDEIFWRARANDNTVFYENEFHTLRFLMPVDVYLGGVRFARPRTPNSDSLIATRVDSIEVLGDTIMIAHMTSFAGDGSGGVSPREYYTPQKLYKDEDRWIRPLSTTPHSRDENMKLIRDYERAAERESQLDNSEGK